MARQTIDYDIVTAPTKSKLISKVKAMLKTKDIWWAQGGVACEVVDGKKMWIQAMARLNE